MRNITQIAAFMRANHNRPGRLFAMEPPQAGATEATMYVYDTIVRNAADAEYWGGVGADEFAKTVHTLAASVKTLHVRINSPGGDVFGAVAMADALRNTHAEVVMHVDGLAASAASFLTTVASRVIVAPESMLMIHRAWTMAWGNMNDLLSAAAVLEKVDGTLAAAYSARTGWTADKALAVMDAETWFTADEAMAAGLAHEKGGTGPKAAIDWDLSAYEKPPTVKPAKSDAQSQPQESKAPATLARRLAMLKRI